MKKILVIFGTRPEAIKMAPVIAELKNHSNFFDVRICVTGQHRQMLDQILVFFDIVPDYDLDLMRFGQDLTDITNGVLVGVREILQSWVPDKILVHGDTTTTFSASLAAFYEKIPVAHVEAGLRTGSMYSPWPEEINRCLTSVIATIHFAPTKSSKKNLLREGVKESTIIITGNTVVDALYSALDRIDKNIDLQIEYKKQFSFLSSELKTILVTGHRRENFGLGFENLCLALHELSKREDLQIVYPVHLNPNVQEPVYRILKNCPRVHLIEPQDYLSFVYLMNKSFIIITDSGGIQEEAPSLGKPVLVTRNTTERPEAVEAGAVRLVGTAINSIVMQTTKLLDSAEEYQTMKSANNPYGDGQAAKRIVQHLIEE